MKRGYTVDVDIHSDEFTREVQAAVAGARDEALKAGVSLFYLDSSSGLNVMEQPDGRKFEIRFIPGAPADRNYDVVRELTRAAA